MTSHRYVHDAAQGGQDETDPDPVNEDALGGDRASPDGPISERVGRNPGNLGDEVPAPTDVVHPAPDAGSGEDLGAGEM
jgi:hypothetical protein